MPLLSSSLALSPVVVAGYYIDGTDLDDSLYGTDYADTMHGRRGNDMLSGGAGNDVMFGEEGNDWLYGGTGNDTLDGGIGDDVLDGGAGDDLFIGGAGADHFIGGLGWRSIDTVSYSSSSAAVFVDLGLNYAVGGDAQGDTFDSIEKVIGSNYADMLIGGAANETFTGGAGDDTLSGGIGNDALTGGAGADVFMFHRGDAFGGDDTVFDFQKGVDRIALAGFESPVNYNGVYTGSFGRDGQLMTGIDVSSIPAPEGHHPVPEALFYDTDDHQLYELTYDAYNRTYQSDLLATFANGTVLDTSDFIFI
jgi:Ca2+-binding RTX toxin-like protein